MRRCGLSIVLGIIDFWKNRYNISDLKPIVSIYLFRGVLCFWGTYGIILTFFGTYKVQNQQNKLLPRPENTISDRYCCRYCSWYRYSDILVFIFGAFQNQYCNFWKTDTIYWFIAQHYLSTHISFTLLLGLWLAQVIKFLCLDFVDITSGKPITLYSFNSIIPLKF